MSERAPTTEANRRSWVFIAIAALGLVVLALLVRPCEIYRLEVFLRYSEFGWKNTVCAPMEERGCHCLTSGGDDPWVIGEWTNEPRRLSSPAQDVIPAVEF